MVTRAEQRQATLLALSAAAIDRFEVRGPAATVDEIAAAAGVSRRTVFRHVESKEALAFIHPLLWLDVFDGALGADPAPRDAWQAIRVGAEAIAAHVDAAPAAPRRAFHIAVRHPELRSGFAPVTARWIERFGEVIAEAPEPTEPLRVRILAHATMGMIDAVTGTWLVDSTMSYGEALAEGFSVMRPLFDGRSSSSS